MKREQRYYHVAADWNGQNLESLYAQYGDDAYDMYLDRWPESENLGTYHAHVIHLHSTIEEARDYAVVYGGQVLEIDGRYLEIDIDTHEYDHPVSQHTIPASAIKITTGEQR